ncbi:hypothetical protein BCR33DRAFT_517787 [Rhizoclosmatium globosum]|uniref:Uncharacterized protein n=1 Tax=Rhizoclosmatium globosum TaxID=329046 RepID=A0A1Y2BGR1_9FUNG|nr:hypothetical protein BCR33DRAFT_517787 [Rhizoclosmatium globosum]|eukprot:ORY33916.1 hypothetical protein BCR33DRAFT_517787 [Rhizoclosmatium globosum]
MSDNGLLKNGDEALFRMIPLCRVCITKIEDILQAGAMLATMKPSTPQLPSPLAKASARNNSSFFGVDEKPSSGAPEVSLFSAVLDSFPPEFSLKSDAKASPAGVRKSVTLDSYDLRDSKQNSLMRASAEEYANDGERSVQLSIVTNPDGPTSREGSVTKSNEPKLDEVKAEEPQIPA